VIRRYFPIALCLLFFALECAAQSRAHFGYDQNVYPGDAMLPLLHKNYDYAGYWLNAPPGENVNQWKGKRSLLVKEGFGFLILFNGRLAAELKGLDPIATGRADAELAIAAAASEGFPKFAILFLDVEEGGRMVSPVATYVTAWMDAVRRSEFRPGVYCSGIEVDEGQGKMISTADDIHAREPEAALWVANDVCPPAPGCAAPKKLRMEDLGRSDALVWQYAQSPRRKQFTQQCAATYAADGNCYVPGAPRTEQTAVDLNLSNSADPSKGR